MAIATTMRFAARILVLGSLGLAVGCFRGDEREKEAPAGLLGGKCLMPPTLGAPPVCQEGMCNENRNYCYDPADPCEGFFCGGSDRGFCQPDANFLPSCVCELGFNTEQYYLYCCPEPGIGIVDPRCDGAGGVGGADAGASETGAAGSSGGAGSDTGMGSTTGP